MRNGITSDLAKADRDIFAIGDGYQGEGYAYIINFDLGGDYYDQMSIFTNYSVDYANRGSSVDTEIYREATNDLLAIIEGVQIPLNNLDKYISLDQTGSIGS